MPELPESTERLLGLIRAASDIPESTKQKIEDSARTPPRALEGDRWIYRIVVGALSAIALLAITFSFVIFLHAGDKTDVRIPEIMIALGSASVGALAGLLAPSPGTRASA